MKIKTKATLRYTLAFAMMAVGITHFTAPAIYTAMVPPQLPSPLWLVYISGVAELAGGLGLLIPPLRRAASLGLIALYIAVFPANVHMALAELPFSGQPVPTWLLWARLPFQAVFIVWAYWVGKADAAPPEAVKTVNSDEKIGKARIPGII